MSLTKLIEMLLINFRRDVVETNDLTHHGVLGQKWGVRRYQNKDGTLTDAGQKKRKQLLKLDKKIRNELEADAYDSANFANTYYKKLKRYSKKYEKAIIKDPTKSSLKTQRIENTKYMLESDAKKWNNYNSHNIQKLKSQVNYMVNEYSDTKIKDINLKNKNGIEFVNSFRTVIYNANVSYDLKKRTYHQYDGYTPVKTRHYYTSY